jgi:hypothetical protein
MFMKSIAFLLMLISKVISKSLNFKTSSEHSLALAMKYVGFRVKIRIILVTIFVLVVIIVILFLVKFCT